MTIVTVEFGKVIAGRPDFSTVVARQFEVDDQDADNAINDACGCFDVPDDLAAKGYSVFNAGYQIRD